DWRDDGSDDPGQTALAAFSELGVPNLFWGVTGGNMDSLVNHYTSERKPRSDDAYTPGGGAGARPDRAVLVYTQRCREASRAAGFDVPVVIGGIEASLRRIAHYDYWSDKVRRSVLLDAKADLLVYGNAERAIVEIAHRLGEGEDITGLRDIRGTAYPLSAKDTHLRELTEIDSTDVDQPAGLVKVRRQAARLPREQTVVRLPAFEVVRNDKTLYAHTSRILHQEANPHNGRVLIQRHGNRDVVLNPPPVPLTTPEMDSVFELPYQRRPYPGYGDAKIPAYEMIKTSVMIMRGCFGGCSFCSITEHEGRIIQSRSKDSVLREIEHIRDNVPGFTGIISDVGGPTANMWRLGCRDPNIEAACRRPSCVYPGICENLRTDHSELIELYREARALPGVKKILVASGLR
ncbi:MAG: YgiQ family radical SAM protein, partial [Nannocystaceae bacterium]